MATKTTYDVITNDKGKQHSLVHWYNDLGWYQTDARTEWKKSFLLWPRKSYFSYARIWGKCYKRTTKYMCLFDGGHVQDPVDCDTEYATPKEAFKDKLKGAV